MITSQLKLEWTLTPNEDGDPENTQWLTRGPTYLVGVPTPGMVLHFPYGEFTARNVSMVPLFYGAVDATAIAMIVEVDFTTVVYADGVRRCAERCGRQVMLDFLREKQWELVIR